MFRTHSSSWTSQKHWSFTKLTKQQTKPWLWNLWKTYVSFDSTSQRETRGPYVNPDLVFFYKIWINTHLLGLLTYRFLSGIVGPHFHWTSAKNDSLKRAHTHTQTRERSASNIEPVSLDSRLTVQTLNYLWTMKKHAVCLFVWARRRL